MSAIDRELFWSFLRDYVASNSVSAQAARDLFAMPEPSPRRAGRHDIVFHGAHIVTYEARFNTQLGIVGDAQSAVPDETVTELIALAKAGNREDFDFLAGACGVTERDTLWSGTRARLHLSEAKPEEERP